MVSNRSHSIWMTSRLHRNVLNFFSLSLLLFAFCASSTVARAQAAYVQQCSAYGGYVETASCTLSGVGAGHSLLIGVYVSSTVTPTITSSSGTPSSVISNLADYQGEMDAALLANTASGNITITATTTSYTNIWITVSEYSGVAASPLDTSAMASLQGGWDSTSVVSANFSTTAANDMLWSMCYGIPSYVQWSAGTAPITWTAANSYSGSGVIAEYGVAGAAGTYYGQCNSTTTNGGAEQASIMTVALKPASNIVATPTFSPAAGTYASPQTVTISDSTSGSTIYYTTDGTTPTTASTVYSSAITVSVSEMLKALATHSGYTNSSIGSAAYVINGPAATPTFSPAAGAYGPAQTVTISDATPGATIYYTTNGTTPTTSSSTYSSPITVSATETLEAIAVAPLYMTSGTGSATYTINGAVATPTFSPAAGTYGPAQTVTISDGTAGVTIYYTTNGTTPTTSSTVYSSAIVVSASETLEALATKAGYSNSAVGSATYTINGAVATPTFSPAAGTYSSAQTVTISDGTAGATIYYTTNGTTPTTSSTVYSSAITVSATETLEALATKAGYANSAVASATYTIGSSGTPAFVQQCSNYDGYGTTATCTLNGVGAGHALLIGIYTGSSTSPTVTATTGAPTSVISNYPDYAGVMDAYLLANTASGNNTITVTVPTSMGIWLSVSEVSGIATSPLDTSADAGPTGGWDAATVVTGNFNTTGANDMLWSMCYGIPSYVQWSAGTAPITWTAANSYSSGGLITEYGLASTAGTYYGQCNTTITNGGADQASIMTVALKAGSSGGSTAATPTFSPAAGTYTSVQTVTISDTTPGATIYYTTNGNTPTTSSSVYSSPITVSASETLKAIATASGYTQSAVGSAAYTINLTAATPTFSPGAGTYGSAQTVTISDGTTGATIYYTTNGNTPTTSSSVYSSPITVSASETLKAIATASGYAQSAVGSAAYTITLQAATPTFSPGGGTYGSAQTVTISDGTPGATIYYTTNGTSPTTSSAVYGSPITVSSSETLEAIATASGYSQSATGSAVYTIGASGAIMTVQHNSGSTETGTSLAVAFTSNVTAGNVLLVAESTYDAETLGAPTDTQGNSYTQLVTAGTSGDSVAAIYAATAKSSGADTVTCNISATNNIHCHIYEVQGITTTVDQTGNSTVASTSQTVSTSAATTNADDYVFAFFSDNAKGATLTSGPGYGDTDTSNDGGDTALTENKVVIATGVQTATATSNTSDADVNVIVALKATGTPTVSTPTFTPVAGTYATAQSVTINDWTVGSTIYYTTNGSTPTTSSAVYSSPIVVSATETIKALATATGYAQSPVATGSFIIAPLAATPTFSPAGGTYTTTQSVTISDGTGGATIYYTTNGTMPTTNSSVYSSPVIVSASETVEAIATAAGYQQSLTGSAIYTINPIATPTFSPGGGTYTSVQTVTISDSTGGVTIYYTTNGSTPTTSSTVYSGPVTVATDEELSAIAAKSGFPNSAVGTATYVINTGTAGTCDGMSVGSSVNGTANLNGFVPFQSATGMVTQWNTNIANAPIDPNNATIQAAAGYSGESTHINFGSSPGDGGIPFMIVDSSQTPSVPINVIDYANQSDVVVAPYPNNVPIEGNAADCSGWPDTYQSDSHTNVLDRHTCWDYETYNTNRCNGLYDASGEAIWDMANGNMRPWGWTSTDAAGLSVMAGLLKYDEAASGHINHAIRFTMQQSKNDANGGYFVEPASHAAGTSYGAPVVEGMRVRLKSTFNISGYSAINQAILTALQQYGMIMADNGGYFFIQGATDSRWNDADLVNLAGIPSSNFDVIQMTPAYPGWDSTTAPTGTAPVINSFSSSATQVSPGTPVTFTFSASGDSYDYIDMIGPVRLSSGSGSVTITPTATQTYMLYSVNQYGNNGSGAGYGVTVSNPITVVVTGSTVVPPTFTPVAGTYTGAQVVTLNSTTYPYAAIYYTTDGSTPTYPPTGTTKQYPAVPQPMSQQSVGALESITISASETVKAIAVVPGYSSPSAVSSATYVIN